MRTCLTILICSLLFSLSATAQNDSLKIDSLKKVLQTQREDTNKVNTLNVLCVTLLKNGEYKDGMQFGKEAIALSEQLHFSKGAGLAYRRIAYAYWLQNNYRSAQENFFTALKMLQDGKDTLNLAWAYSDLADLYKSSLGNYSQSLNYAYTALQLYEAKGDKNAIANTLTQIGNINIAQGNLSDALDEFGRARELYRQAGNKHGVAVCSSAIGDVLIKQNDYAGAIKKYIDALKTYEDSHDLNWIGWSYQSIGMVYEAQGEEALARNKKKADSLLDLALNNYKNTQKIFTERKDVHGIAISNITIGSTNVKLQNFERAVKSLRQGIEQAKKNSDKAFVTNGLKALTELDSAKGDYKQAYEHYKMYILSRDSLVNEEESRKSQVIKNKYEYDKQNAIAKAEQDKKDAEAKRVKNRQYFIIAVLGIVVLTVVIIAFIQYRNSKHKQKANALLQHQKEEIQQQKEKVESTLSELRSTQAQLIQSEKMASLGELTAGIAHEIQNPLNFVNNFSEVNTELIRELVDEVDKGNYDEVKAIADDIKDNEQKILHHGKRADAIVKGMLQHSRASTGKKEPADINALADEYLRLSYHGMRAKDKSFNAILETNFDNTIKKINVVPQDIGRVLLNLFNNAFYAIGERRKAEGERFEPLVSVCTKKVDSKVEIHVKDNGVGIPQKVVDKIFQPFFTTKPTGQGTGLGLSLSYDIIKAHGGEIKVETKEGEGSEFIIQLPII